MTTIAVDLRRMEIAADTQNTDSSGAKFRCHKIERLRDGRYFLGSGHNLGIGKAKRWADAGFAEDARPDFEEMFGERADDFGFSCAVIAPGPVVTMVDDEMEPYTLADDYFALGAGAAYAIGAMDQGATALEAVRIACRRDTNSSEPIDVSAITFP